MLRREWKFTVPASELRQRAAQKVEHHKGRLAHYESERARLHDGFVKSVSEAAEKAAGEEALEAEVYLSKLDMSSSTLGIPQPKTIQGDQEIRQRLNQVIAKISEHTGKIGTYEMWVELLSREEQAIEREIDIEDAHFFGL